MEPMMVASKSASRNPGRASVSENSCAHSRAIDDVLTARGKRTGKVRCLECLTIIDDPYRGLK
jgi:hypothetical protein